MRTPTRRTRLDRYSLPMTDGDKTIWHDYYIAADVRAVFTGFLEEALTEKTTAYFHTEAKRLLAMLEGKP